MKIFALLVINTKRMRLIESTK